MKNRFISLSAVSLESEACITFREVLLEKLQEVIIPETSKHMAALTPQVDTEALVKSAEMLLQAENPLL